MNTPYEASTLNRAASRTVKTKPKKSFRFIWFLIAWILLISGGITGAYYYTEQLKLQIVSELYTQTQLQLDQVQLDYENLIIELEGSIEEQILQLQTKVDSLTGLLAFTRDNATDQSDLSNQLYVQLSEVKKQLDELKSNLDVLK